jgi:glycosyltransferase involved in cell wall biosynthesis
MNYQVDNIPASAVSAPRVSVIIPTFNRVGVLYYALHSVLNQTFSEFEVFVIDDASTDSTAEFMASIKDPRVHYIRFDTNRKAAAARNAGMEQARGEYIAFLDSDDEWWPTKLEKQVALMDSLSDEWGCCYGGAYVNKVGGLTSHRVFRPKKSGNLLKDLLTNKLVIWTPTFMFRRACLEHVELMDNALVRSQDVDFYIRLLERYKMVAMEEPLVNIYLVLNKNLAKVAGESRRILLAKHTDLIQSLGKYSASYVYSMGDMVQAEAFFTDGQNEQGVSLLKRAIARNPFLPIRRYVAISKHLVRMLFSGSGD